MQNSVVYKNAKISFSSTGKGAAIVLLHGFLENSSMWNSITKELSKRNKVICIDLLGHGNSECIGANKLVQDNFENMVQMSFTNLFRRK